MNRPFVVATPPGVALRPWPPARPLWCFAAHVARLSWLVPLVGVAGPAWAQAEAATATLEAVTVEAQTEGRLTRTPQTGSKLALSALETPASVETLTREQLEARGDASLVDAITRATGFTSLAHPGNSGSSLAVRGFTDTTSVMRLYDGTRQYGGVGVSYPFDTWGVDRIEVLRGPASVIHGDGAIGGVVNVIPKKPQRGALSHELQTRLGSHGRQALAFGSGGALSEQLSYRLDVGGDRDNGWVARGQSRKLSVSGALQLNATPDLQIKLSHAQGRQHPMRYFGMPLVNGAPWPALAGQNYNVADSHIRYRDAWTELSALWTPSAQVVVRSKLYRITSQRDWRNAEGYAYNAGTGLIDRSDNTQIAHDQAQLGASVDASFTGRLLGLDNTASIGVDLSRSRFQHSNNTYAGSSGSVDPFDPEPGLFASAAPFIPRYRNRASQYAVFAEDRLALTDRLSVVGGLRYDHTRLQRQDLVAATQAFDKAYASWSGRLGVVLQLRPDLSLYAQHARAADPIAGLLMLSPANSAFGLAKGRQWEVGIKQVFQEGTGEWTLAAYRIQKNNLLTRDPTDPARSVQVGQRSSRGLEGTLALALTPTLRLDANAALLRARYDDFTEVVGGVPVSRNGQVPTDVPQRVANLWLSWQVAPAWTLAGGARHVGKRYANSANTLVLPSYTTTDLSLQWRVQPGTTLTLRGTNVFNKRYYTTAYYTATQWFVGEPRRVELAFHHRF
ncbi:TonB-dependent siderophore receptor [Comamonas serinivorans]|uniref:TonB-dependent siderophore receptor n=1 Tax=Comamonas serinivorans TaxID=1082851 RepID=A0A1Y0EKZ1_9BURK|nr:TonB-dependent receptor [Comamonas serinivorans]ARU04039.1 TonB-dependent siderophore receptor [Comamonas serinivorans]